MLNKRQVVASFEVVNGCTINKKYEMNSSWDELTDLTIASHASHALDNLLMASLTIKVFEHCMYSYAQRMIRFFSNDHS